MTPKHAKTGYFLKQGILDDVKTFAEVEKRISRIPVDKERGDAFEVFAEAYLVTQPAMQARQVWPFEKIPPATKRKFGLDVPMDIGVDGLIQTTGDEHHAYQVKFRTGRVSLTWKGDLSTFVGLADKTDQKLIFTNANKIPDHLEKREDVYCVRGYDLDRLEARDFQQMLNWLKKTERPRPRKEPRDYQEEAIEAITEALAGTTSKRATAVMACGTGKTLIALWAAERLGYRKVLVLVPSLALLSQTLRDWMRDTSWKDLSYICVCSDPTVTKGADNWEVRQADLPFPVGTDSGVVKEFLAKRTGGVKIVFSTYQSARVVAEGLTDKTGFDLGIFDEAHKTAGREGRNFAFALDDANLPIKRRLFLTATPRHYNVLQKDKEGESRLVYSMDDEGTYGPRVYQLPFVEAASRDIICGYKVLISVVTSDEVNEDFLRRGEVLVKGDEVRARQVANQLALKRATEKTPVKKAFTFHTFVRYAASFTAEGGEGLHAHLPSFETYHVSGSMPTATREERLHEFEVAKKAVMSNARCLTEGVNVPVVDMVAFMSPKKSRVDIVQATGRAMRRAGRKKRGYILIPLFLQKAKKESIEDALERTDFSEVWDVLQAMAEQDSELAEIISEMVAGKAAKGAKGYDDLRFRGKVEVLGPEVSLEKLRTAITVRCVEKLGVTWDERYGELVAYKEEHGDCLVPAKYPPNVHLGMWVSVQRTNYKKNRLSQDRIAGLNNLGFIWDVLEAHWEEMYKALVEYKEEHGDCNVPNQYPTNPELGRWVCNVQRPLYKRGVLTTEKIKRLEAIDFVWDLKEYQWEEMYQALVDYRKEHGDCNVPHNYANNQQLAHWVANQRVNYRRRQLPKDKTARLKALGFIWNPREEKYEARWEDMYKELARFHEEHGHCNVPSLYGENRELGIWVNNQRSRRNRLSKEKIERLEELGFAWNTIEARWEEMYQALVEYRKEHGDCNVPRRYPAAPELSTWVGNQRHRKDRLSEDQISRLDELGFCWEPYDAQWEIMYQALVDYRKEHGDCNVPQRKRGLGHWVNRQRSDYREGKLRKDKAAKLDEVGFVWDMLEAQWEEMYQELIIYKSQYGHCDVPQKSSKLGRWVNTQRQAYKRGALSTDKIGKLKKIGFKLGESLSDRWENMYQELIKYKERYGDCNVSSRFPENPKLGTWVANQRANYRKDNLRKDSVKKLEEIGFEWEPMKRPKGSG